MDIHELLDPFERMLQAACPPAAVRAVEAGGSATAMWEAVAESGFLDALVPEDAGGFGLSLAEVGPLWQVLGRHAVPLPVAETMVARWLLALAGQAWPEGPIALAASHGLAQFPVPFGLVAGHMLLDDGSQLVLAEVGGAAPLAHASIDATCTTSDLAGAPSCDRPLGGLAPLAALARAAAMAGAGDRLLDMTVAYANERVQFGKPIGRQQALQQQLAVMAENVVAMRLAVQLACARGLPLDPALAATAKSITSAAAARVANTAHAVHGAIGISEEHDLQLYTRRLHDWRLAWGSESYWNAVLGSARLGESAPSVDWVRGRLFG